MRTLANGDTSTLANGPEELSLSHSLSIQARLRTVARSGGEVY
jgi:hypothetical protein